MSVASICRVLWARKLGADRFGGGGDQCHRRPGGRQHRAARPSEIARHLDRDVETIAEALAAHDVAHMASLDEPEWRDDRVGSGDGARVAAALVHTEPEIDLVEHREGLAPLLAALPDRERAISRLRSRTLTELRRRLITD
jgi:RNA polymerase sigma-B factor